MSLSRLMAGMVRVKAALCYAILIAPLHGDEEMAWEKRQRGGLYYTQSYRENGRVRRRYIGTGNLATLIAKADALIREQRESTRLLEREKRRDEKEEDREFQAYFDEVQRTLEAVLVEAGYHKHKRQWRKRRGKADKG